MNNEELQLELQKHDKTLPIWYKVDQEITGNDDYGWMRGGIGRVYTEEIFLDTRQGEGGSYVTRDRLGDHIDNDPELYLEDYDPETWSDDWYEVQKKKFMDETNFEMVLMIEIGPE